MNVECTQHSISASYDGHLLITGFQDVDVDVLWPMAIVITIMGLQMTVSCTAARPEQCLTVI